MRMRITTLRKRLVLQIGLMIGGMLIVGIVAIGGVNRIHEDFGVTVRGYRELRSIYEIGFYLSTAESALQAPVPDRGNALASVRLAIGVLVPSDPAVDSEPLPLSQWLGGSDVGGGELLLDLRKGEASLANGGELSDVNLPLGKCMAQLRELSNDVSATIAQREQAVALERRDALLADGVVGVVVTAGALRIGR